MGMAASQARLLMITSRIHDLEHRAMCIQDEKIMLATQSDEIYKKYTDALDAYSLAVGGNGGNAGVAAGQPTKPIRATFNNLTGPNAIDTGLRKILKDNNSGKVIVSDDVAKAYAEYKGNNAQEFAMIMLDKNAYDENGREAAENKIYDKYMNSEREHDKQLVGIKDKMNAILGDNNTNDPSTLDDDTKQEYEDLEESFRSNIYRHHGDEIMSEITGNDIKDVSNDDIKYYVDLFNCIKAAGGCTSIEDYNLDKINGKTAADDSNLLDYLINSGKAGIFALDEDDKTGTIREIATGPSTEANIGNVADTSIEKSKLMKAQAEFENESKKIDNKEKRKDQELNKIETERSALTKEYDSTKKVIQDNIERTFGIFS